MSENKTELNTTISPAEARAIAKEAYVYGYPVREAGRQHDGLPR